MLAASPGSSAVTITASAELSVQAARRLSSQEAGDASATKRSLLGPGALAAAFIADRNAREGIEAAIASACDLDSGDVKVGLSASSGNNNTATANNVNLNIRIEKLVEGDLARAKMAAVMLVGALGGADKEKLASAIVDQIKKAAESKKEVPVQYAAQVLFLSPRKAVVDNPQTMMGLNMTAELSTPDAEAFISDANLGRTP